MHDAMGFRESVKLLPQNSESGREGVSETKEARKSSSNAPGLDWDNGIGEARRVFLRAELIERRVS